MKRGIFLLLIFNLLACAVQGPPSGGPVDRTPPEIVQSSLLPGAVHVSQNLKEIRFTFSEAMKEGSERNNLFLSPPLEFSSEWKRGKILLIRFHEALKNNQTYVFTVGSGIQDLRNNKMAQSFILAFSTGDSIDQGQISGKVYDLKAGETFNVFAYLLSDSQAFDPFKQKPDYISQTGEDGAFALQFLKNGCYRLLAVEDRNHNLVVDAIIERFALSYQDVCLDSVHHNFRGIGLKLAQFDTLAPQVIAVRALYQDWVRVRFSEPVVLDSTFNVQIQDSANQQEVPITFMGKNPENRNWLDILTQPLDSAKTYSIHFSQFKDSSGNRQSDQLDYYFKGSAKKDTTRLKIVKYFPQDSAKNIRPESKIYFRFSLPIRWPEWMEHFSLILPSGQEVPGAWHRYSLFDGAFVPDALLKPDSQYVVRFNWQEVHDFRGQPPADSLSAFTFFVVSAKEMGQVSGTVTEEHPAHPLVLTLQKLSGKRLTLKTVLQNSNRFYFPYVPEGDYRLQGYEDRNSNGRFDSGRLLPFQFCEPFALYPDTITVRKRWETSGIKFSLPITKEGP